MADPAYAQLAVSVLGGLGGTIILLTPGYVFSKAFGRGIRAPELSAQAFIASTAMAGVFVHAISLFWTMSLIDRAWAQFAASAREPILFAEIAVWTLVVLLIFPAVAGATWARVTDIRAQPLAAIFDWVGVGTARRTAEAWVWTFLELERRKRGSHVLVRMKSGPPYLGTFGPSSLASSDPRMRDIYLEELWPCDADGRLTAEEPMGRQVWISGESIAAIELVPEKEDDDAGTG